MCPRGDTASIALIPSFHARFTVHRELRPATAARSSRPHNAKGDADEPQDAHDLNEPLRQWPVPRRARSTTHRMLTEPFDRRRKTDSLPRSTPRSPRNRDNRVPHAQRARKGRSKISTSSPLRDGQVIMKGVNSVTGTTPLRDTDAGPLSSESREPAMLPFGFHLT